MLHVDCDLGSHPVDLGPQQLYVGEEQEELLLRIYNKVYYVSDHATEKVKVFESSKNKEEVNVPLHPDRMSMPMTCTSSSSVIHVSMHDIIFHVIFGHDSDTIREFLLASSARLHSIVKCRHLAATADVVAKQVPPLDTLKAMFFLFLNVDMVLKNYVCMPGSEEAFAAAMNAKAGAEGLTKLHAWSMVGTRPISAAKARNFFLELHRKVVKQWLQDERKTPRDLVDAVKEAYLVS